MHPIYGLAARCSAVSLSLICVLYLLLMLPRRIAIGVCVRLSWVCVCHGDFRIRWRIRRNRCRVVFWRWDGGWSVCLFWLLVGMMLVCSYFLSVAGEAACSGWYVLSKELCCSMCFLCALMHLISCSMMLLGCLVPYWGLFSGQRGQLSSLTHIRLMDLLGWRLKGHNMYYTTLAFEWTYNLQIWRLY